MPACLPVCRPACNRRSQGCKALRRQTCNINNKNDPQKKYRLGMVSKNHRRKTKQRGQISTSLKKYPLKLIKQHFTHTICVSPSPAGPAGCHPLNFLNLVNLKFRVRAPNECCIKFMPNQSFACNVLCNHRCKKRRQRSGIDTIKHHTWPEPPLGRVRKAQENITHKRAKNSALAQQVITRLQ